MRVRWTFIVRFQILSTNNYRFSAISSWLIEAGLINSLDLLIVDNSFLSIALSVKVSGASIIDRYNKAGSV